jgi:hypothetical protein
MQYQTCLVRVCWFGWLGGTQALTSCYTTDRMQAIMLLTNACTGLYKWLSSSGLLQISEVWGHISANLALPDA